MESIKTFYEKQAHSEKNASIVKNLKGWIMKCNRANFKEEVIKEAEMYFDDEYLKDKLNSKSYLIPFSNGVYNLHEKCFKDNMPFYLLLPLVNLQTILPTLCVPFLYTKWF